MTENETAATAAAFTAPYVSWGSFINLLDRMEQESIPARIDRHYLSNMAGSTQAHLVKALREFDLVDDGKHPTDDLKELVPKEGRPEKIAELIRDHYQAALSLGDNASQSMLEDVFTEQYNVQGSTRRKSIAFFLAAAKFADVPVSRFFKTPKRSPTNGPKTGRARKRQETGDQTPPPPPPPVTDAKQQYINLLLKKAEENMDTDLLDRLERVIGIGGNTTSAPTDRGAGLDRGGDPD